MDDLEGGHLKTKLGGLSSPTVEPTGPREQKRTDTI